MRSRVFPLAIITLFTPICFIALQASHSTETAPASASQQVQDHIRKEVREACPVTKPPDQPFVPPAPYWTNHGPDRFWYGTESLWTLLAVQGTWKIRNNVLEGEGGYRTKLIYWRRGFDWRTELEPGLIVIARRLDREAPPVAAAAPAHAVFVTGRQPAAMMTAIDIPTTGCWRLTAQYRDQELSFVVSVEP
jgi:hypothetical protein